MYSTYPFGCTTLTASWSITLHPVNPPLPIAAPLTDQFLTSSSYHVLAGDPSTLSSAIARVDYTRNYLHCNSPWPAIGKCNRCQAHDKYWNALFPVLEQSSMSCAAGTVTIHRELVWPETGCKNSATSIPNSFVKLNFVARERAATNTKLDREKQKRPE